jgi:hypothetical protein
MAEPGGVAKMLLVQAAPPDQRGFPTIWHLNSCRTATCA